MFPITCNAFGDIVAIVELVREIVGALDDARGAAEEYKQFVHVLTAVGTVMEEIYCLAKDSRNEGLKQAVLAEVRRVCGEISSATDNIIGFEKLTEASARSSRARDHPRELFTKLRWHFQKSSDAGKYVRSFSESLHRLNAFIAILGFHSASQMFAAQRDHAVHMAHEQSRAIWESAETIKAVALSAIHQVSMQSRQQVAEQALARPFFTSSAQDRRIAYCVKRVTDTIFDHLAPHTPVAQRKQFLSLLAPFAFMGAAFVVHINADPRWRVPFLWATVVALVVKVLWLESSIPMHTDFNCDNAISVVDLLGERITVPYQFCFSFEMLHRFLDLLYSGTQREGHEFVQEESYELYVAGTLQLLTLDNWLSCIHLGICLEMGLVLFNSRLYGEAPECPYCFHRYYCEETVSEIVCANCSQRHLQTTGIISIPQVMATHAAATMLQSVQRAEYPSVPQLDALLSSSATSIYVFHGHELIRRHSTASMLTHGYPRVHVINQYWTCALAPEDFEQGAEVYWEAIESSRFPNAIEEPHSYCEVLFTYLYMLSYLASNFAYMLALGDPDFDYFAYMVHTMKSVIEGMKAKAEKGRTSGSRGHIGSRRTIPAMQQVETAAIIEASSTELSPEHVHRWNDSFARHSRQHLTPDEAVRFEELVKDPAIMGGTFKNICDSVGRRSAAFLPKST